MNIGFDAKRAFYNRTGLGNYSRSLIKALQSFSDNQWQLFVPELKAKHLFDELPTMQNVQVIAAPHWVPKHFWRSTFIKKDFRAVKTEVYHGLSAELPFGKKPKGVKYVVTIHDLIFERYPNLYPALDRAIYRSKTKYACAVADRIIAISEQTKNDLVSFYNIDAQKIEVVYQDCDPVFSIPVGVSQKEKVSAKYQLPAQFLLSVGTLETRKNALVILKALLDLPSEVHLCLVGRATPYVEILKSFVQKNGLEKRVLFLHEVSFEDLPTIYQLARIFVYPSVFEGFGIPIIEAIKSEVPVIAATGSCLEETGGPQSLYFEPEDHKTLAGHISYLWNNEAERQAQIAKSLIFVQKFSAKHFAQNTFSVYHDLG